MTLGMGYLPWVTRSFARSAPMYSCAQSGDNPASCRQAFSQVTDRSKGQDSWRTPGST